MSEPLLSLPEACERALAAIEQDPLDLPLEILAHLRECPSCAEARVHWLAQEEAPFALAPAGYFDRLPERIQRKLPAKPGRLHRPVKILWAAAAALMLAAAGVGGFWLGKAHKAPLVEATLPGDFPEVAPETPFQDGDETITQLHRLSPEEAEAVLNRLEGRATPQP